ADVYKLLPMDECIRLMAEAFKTLGRGDALNPLRRGFMLPDKSALLAMMPAYMSDIKAMGLKILSIVPSNQSPEYDSHMGVVLLFEIEQGKLRSIIEAGSITAIRTAAASGLATDLLARKDAGNLAILGSGIQAQSHISAMQAVRKIERIRVWSRTPEHAERFTRKESARNTLKIENCATVEEAVKGADIICTCTGAVEPILLGKEISLGAHINAVGSSIPFARELDSEAVAGATLFVDRRESAFNEAGDFLIPKKEGVIDDNHIKGEIGELLLGLVEGRRSPDETTIFKSLGIAVQDLVSANYLFNKAVETGIGTWIEF